MTQSEEISVSLDMIRTDSDIESKEKQHICIIKHFAKVMRDGDDYPSVICFFDGKHYRLIYGINLLKAAELAGQKTILVDVHSNPYIYPRKNDDKGRTVKKVLSLLEAMGEDEKLNWSTYKIAAICCVSERTVCNWIKKCGYEAPEVIQAWNRHGAKRDYQVNTHNIRQSNQSKSKANGFNWTAINDKQFEEIVYELVKSYNLNYIDWRTGTGGKGRDIEAKFKINGGLDEEREELYFIEAKHFKKGVNWVHLSNAFTWAEKFKPSVFVIAVSSHLANNCRDEISAWEKIHSYIHVIRWDRKNIQELVLSKPAVKNLAVKLKLIPKSMQ
ncbi:restriction endonuclease [Coleofasciculus sp. FACHB-129]|uniref:restriction endonuclease n=1 Tax=Cyanophyceae TaxID=3028117 RepID=UPI00168374FD|nr:restriction endonuclease [Coleofasciculus sp. FACHB-129]MBD1898319.1 restriction endonuclease [Coleofasciculus sp. FACHB-129]